jgi:hypothetical protein
MLCSKFLRCIETAHELLQQFIDRSAKTKRSCLTHTKRVKPSIWELDGIHNGLHHEHVRNIEEITKGDPGTSQVLKLLLFHISSITSQNRKRKAFKISKIPSCKRCHTQYLHLSSQSNYNYHYACGGLYWLS